ncbi:MAG: hydantoinase B/oxoprolinase family protein [Chloroflexi bacterium]|nr:hydantoinase B/oxoprolinase family protein [Chloroflexota bacterium]
MSTTTIDPITFQVIVTSLSGIVREMQRSLFRTGFSTIIRESLDASCAVLDSQARLVGQDVNLTLHMGAFPVCAENLLKSYPPAEIEEGDAFILNHPYFGGSPHVLDMAVLTPAFHEGKLVAFCANIAHKSDIGGAVPGGNYPQTTEMYQEGIHLVPVRYMRRGQIVKEVDNILRVNSRTPELIIGDIRGQIGTDRIGEDRMARLFSKYGRDTVLAAFDELYDRTERRMRQAIAQWADGSVEVEGFLDHDGIDLSHPVRVHLRLVKEGDHILFDFTGSQDQTRGPVNIRPSLAKAACYAGMLTMVDPTTPCNHGLAQSVDTRFREGSVVNPVPPVSVNRYARTYKLVNTMVLQALIKLTGRPAMGWPGGGGGMTIGWKGTRTGRLYVHYEMPSQATGAIEGDDGAPGRGPRSGMGATKLTPVEIVESEFPTRILRWDVIPDSGGPGQFRGGPGICREYLALDDAIFGTGADMDVIPGWGVNGGGNGNLSALWINPGTDQAKKLHGRIGGYPLKPGDVLRIECSGGGGVGGPRSRDPARVREDVEIGWVSPKAAAELYGISPQDLSTPSGDGA